MHRLTALVMPLLLISACSGSDAPGADDSDTAPDAASADAGSDGDGSYFAYIGTSDGDPENGIHVLRFDPADGSLERATSPVTPILNPSFLALAPDGGTLYAVSEAEEGAVVGYRTDPGTGALTEIGRASSGGAGPAYVSVDGSGEWIAAANYGGGSVALLPVNEDGAPGEPVDVVQHEGSGPDAERQETPHAHYARTSPDDRWVLVADLGIDQVIAYPLAGGDEGLAADRATVTRTAPGAGPRHIAFHPERPFAYVMNELNGTVTAYRYDAETGALAEIETVSALPSDFDGENKSADIHVHPNGRWLYASNRGDFDSVAHFAIDPDTGRLTPRSHQGEGIVWPRNFAIDPTGRWILVANQQADEVRVYAVDPESGEIEPTPHRVAVPGPTNVTLAPDG